MEIPSTQPEGTLRRILSGEARQAMAYTVTAALSRFGALLLVPIFWQRLSPADYGAIALTELTATIVGSYIGLSLETGLSRLYYEWPEAERRRRQGAVWMMHWGSCLALGALSVPVFALLAPVLFPSVDFYPVVLFGVIYAVLGRMRAFVVAALRIERRVWKFALLHLGGFAVFVAIALYLVVVRDLGVSGYLWALVVSEAIVTVASGIVMLAQATPCVRGAGLREVVRYSLPLVPNSMLGTASTILDAFVLQYVASLEVLGIYSVSNRFVGILPALADALKMSFAPFLYQTASEQGRDAPALIGRVRMFYLVPVFVGGAAVAVFTEDVVRWIDRPEYFAVVYYVPLLVGPALLESLHVYFTSGLLLAKRTDLTWIPTAARLIAIVATGLVLIPQLEIVGLVASRYATVAVSLAVAFRLSQRHYHIPVEWTRLGGLLLAFAGVVYATGYTASSPWLNLIVDAALATMFTAAAVAIVALRRGPR